MEKKIGRIPVGFKIMFTTAAVVLVVFAFLLASGIISFDIAGGSGYLVPDGKSRVPNLVNKDEDEAQELLESENLTFVVDSVVYSSSVPQNKVLTQSLRAGKIIDQGERVVVTVSGGNKTKANGYELQDGEVFVPNLMDMTLEEALAILADNDLVGNIIDPLRGAILDEILSPVDGILFTIREYPVVDEGSLIGRLLRKEVYDR